MLITHDLGVIAEMADFVVVMYAGRIVEKGTAMEVFHNPLHPYTVGLMESKPVVNKEVERYIPFPAVFQILSICRTIVILEIVVTDECLYVMAIIQGKSM